jgi:hypothetical protein
VNPPVGEPRVRLHYTVRVSATAPAPAPAPLARALLRAALRVAGEGALSLAVSVLSLLVAYPHLYWLVRSRTMVRVTDMYRPGDYGGTLFLVARALEGETGHSSVYLAYPEGFAFGGDFSNQWITDAMALAVRLVDMPLGYNLSILAMLASNGVAIYLAARLLKIPLVPALAGAAIASMAPLVVEEILSGRPVSAWWGPAIAATALCAAAMRSWGRLWLAIPGALCLLVSMKVYAYAPLLLLPWTLLAGLAALWPPRWERPVRGLAVLALAAGAAWWGVQEALSQGPGGYLGAPPNMHQASLALKDVVDLGRGGENFIRLPAIPLFGALAVSLLGWRRARSWVPAAIACLLLLAVALGPSARGRGELTVVDPRMPYSWLMEHVALLRGCPRPTRYGMAAGLLNALWLALALGGLWRLRHPAWRWIGGVVALGLVAGMLWQVKHIDRFEYYPPWPPLPQLAALADDRVLLDVPPTFKGDKAIFAQVSYARVPRLNPPSVKYREWLEGTLDPAAKPLTHAVCLLFDGREIPESTLAAIRGGPPEVTELGLRHVVVHRTQLDADQLARYEAFFADLGATVETRDDQLIIYALPTEWGG